MCVFRLKSCILNMCQYTCLSLLDARKACAMSLGHLYNSLKGDSPARARLTYYLLTNLVII